MGVIDNITATRHPKQGRDLGRMVEVCFGYNTSEVLIGTVVRDDAEKPFVTIIRLNDGVRHVLATECQYSLL